MTESNDSQAGLPTDETKPAAETKAKEKKTKAATAAETETTGAKAKAAKTDADASIETAGYLRVKFHLKSDQTQPDDVYLGLNGEALTIKRNVEVVLPRAFLEVADHTTATQYRQEPGKSRKQVGAVQQFPYTILGVGTREEYLAMRRIGTKSAQANADRRAAEEE